MGESFHAVSQAFLCGSGRNSRLVARTVAETVHYVARGVGVSELSRVPLATTRSRVSISRARTSPTERCRTRATSGSASDCCALRVALERCTIALTVSRRTRIWRKQDKVLWGSEDGRGVERWWATLDERVCFGPVEWGWRMLGIRAIDRAGAWGGTLRSIISGAYSAATREAHRPCVAAPDAVRSIPDETDAGRCLADSVGGTSLQ